MPPRRTYADRVLMLMRRNKLTAAERRMVARAQRVRIQPAQLAKALLLCRKRGANPEAIDPYAAVAITHQLRRELRRSAA